MTTDEKLLELQNKSNIFELLEFLLDNERIDPQSSAAGITKKILAQKSFKDLSEKQVRRFIEVVLPIIEIRCKQCGQAMDVPEAYEAYQNSDGSDDLLCLACFDELQTNDIEN